MRNIDGLKSGCYFGQRIQILAQEIITGVQQKIASEIFPQLFGWWLTACLPFYSKTGRSGRFRRNVQCSLRDSSVFGRWCGTNSNCKSTGRRANENWSR